LQEEVENRSVALCIRASKLTADVLKAALQKTLAEMEKNERNRKAPPIYKGKQSVKHLIGQGAGVTSMEITDGNIKSFERTARKYGVDFALKKDASTRPPKYLVFFKSRDTDALTAAFQEYAGQRIKKASRPSVLQKLSQFKALVKIPAVEREKRKEQTR
jgi:hypothetical protein